MVGQSDSLNIFPFFYYFFNKTHFIFQVILPNSIHTPNDFLCFFISLVFLKYILFVSLLEVAYGFKSDSHKVLDLQLKVYTTPVTSACWQPIFFWYHSHWWIRHCLITAIIVANMLFSYIKTIWLWIAIWLGWIFCRPGCLGSNKVSGLLN
jgi:hypothetical protein